MRKPGIVVKNANPMICLATGTSNIISVSTKNCKATISRIWKIFSSNRLIMFIAIHACYDVEVY